MTARSDAPAAEQCRRLLHELPDLLALAALVSTSATAGGEGRRGRPDLRRAPMRLDVLDLTRDDIHRLSLLPGHDQPDGGEHLEEQPALVILHDWVRLADGEMWDAGVDHVPPADAPTVSTETGWLLLHHDWIDEQPWAEEFHADVRRLHRRVSRILGERPEYRPRCRQCRNTVHRHDGEGAWWWSCLACGATYTATTEIAALLAVQSVTLEEAATQLAVPLRTLQRWVRDAGLQPDAGTRRHPRFDLPALARLAASRGRTVAG